MEVSTAEYPLGRRDVAPGYGLRSCINNRADVRYPWHRGGRARPQENRMPPVRPAPATTRLATMIAALLLGAPGAWGAVTAQYLRLDNPTGFVMEMRQIEIFSGGVNVLLNHPEMIT